MHSGRLTTILLLFATSGLFLGLKNEAQSKPPSIGRAKLPPHVPGTLLVRRKSNAAPAPRFRGARLERSSTIELPSVGAEPKPPFEKYRLPEGVSVEEALDELARERPDLEAYPDIRVHALRVPNDPLHPESWGLKNSAQTVSTIAPFSVQPSTGTAGMDIGAEDAWDFHRDCSSVIVAVIDSGIKYDHDDLAENMWPSRGYDFVDDDNDPMDEQGHGTHVAAIIGARGDNEIGIAGVCWNVQLMALRVLDAVGQGKTSDVISAIQFAIANGAKVINLSLGAPGANQPLAEAIAAAEAADIVVVSSAGNQASDNDATPMFPCNGGGEASLCVAALAQNYALTSFSNFGATTVDVGAPGLNVVSAWRGAVTEVAPSMTSGWTFVNSTAAPFGWGYSVANLVGGGSLNLLVNPRNFLQSAQNPSYAPNSTDRVYRTLDASGANAVTLHWTNAVDTFASDFLRVRCAAAGGDPFPSGTLISSQSFAGGTQLAAAAAVVPDDCHTATATFGFQLESDGANQRRGVALAEVTLRKTTNEPDRYAVLSGTSQAAPYVAGIAALVRSYRPYADARRVVEAIKNGGRPVEALSGKTSTGKAVHALGALSYLAAPTNVSAELVVPAKP
jgi:subtilisin family serine protease